MARGTVYLLRVRRNGAMPIRKKGLNARYKPSAQ